MRIRRHRRRNRLPNRLPPLRLRPQAPKLPKRPVQRFPQARRHLKIPAASRPTRRSRTFRKSRRHRPLRSGIRLWRAWPPIGPMPITPMRPPGRPQERRPPHQHPRLRRQRPAILRLVPTWRRHRRRWPRPSLWRHLCPRRHCPRPLHHPVARHPAAHRPAVSIRPTCQGWTPGPQPRLPHPQLLQTPRCRLLRRAEPWVPKR
jgi:hypothetical protein